VRWRGGIGRAPARRTNHLASKCSICAHTHHGDCRRHRNEYPCLPHSFLPAVGDATAGVPIRERYNSSARDKRLLLASWTYGGVLTRPGVKGRAARAIAPGVGVRRAVPLLGRCARVPSWRKGGVPGRRHNRPCRTQPASAADYLAHLGRSLGEPCRWGARASRSSHGRLARFCEDRPKRGRAACGKDSSSPSAAGG
jgi:hypothetical protein